MTTMAMAAYLWESHVLWWVIGVVGGLVACWFGLLFFVALFEKQRIRPLVPAEGRTLVNGNDVVAQAEPLGFRYAGTFSDGDKGFREGICTFMLSPDGAELLWIVRSRFAGRHQVITRLADETWVVTSSVMGTNDQSGLRREEMLPGATLATMLHDHRSRVQAFGQALVPFDLATVADDWTRHARRRAEVVIQKGLGRYRKGDPAGGEGGWASGNVLAWSYTVRGAARLVALHVRDLSQTTRQMKRAETAADEVVQNWWEQK